MSCQTHAQCLCCWRRVGILMYIYRAILFCATIMNERRLDEYEEDHEMHEVAGLSVLIRQQKTRVRKTRKRVYALYVTHSLHDKRYVGVFGSSLVLDDTQRRDIMKYYISIDDDADGSFDEKRGQHNHVKTKCDMIDRYTNNVAMTLSWWFQLVVGVGVLFSI